MKHGIAAAFATVYLYLVTGNAAAQEFPTRAVTILVPFSAGGVVDVGVRLVGEHLSQEMATTGSDREPGGSERDDCCNEQQPQLSRMVIRYWARKLGSALSTHSSSRM